MLVAIGVENDGPAPEFLIKAIGVELCLLLPGARIALGALCLDKR
jgi:hypothetical protein